ncbi:hypothetical protein Vadar_003645 [Vaccinium darrowii]|uniref:Uncharacterized protein n=1 Tax=Vaccinium darrowii TaxID=229202 RepID=A0ACB7XX40_9ERIC|nr:hypothetical protein Vadar_003645 [Vaccinium darrowii]
MDPVSEELKASIPHMQMGMMGGMSISPTLQRFGISDKKMEHVSSSLGLQNSNVLNKRTGQLEPQASNPRLQQFFVPNQQVGHRESVLNNLGSPKVSLPSKRNAAGEPISSSSVAQPLSMPNKNLAHVGPLTSGLVLQQLSTPNKQTVQMDSKHSIPVSHNLPAPTKKMVRNDSISGRSGTKQVQTQKNRSTQVQPLSKVQTDSFESVRSKMRESLASALDLDTRKQDKASNEENDSVNKCALALRQMQQDSYRADAENVSENHADSLALKESCSAYKGNDDHNTSRKILASESICDSSQTRHLTQGKTACPSEDIPCADSFLVKDEPLQGNGLAWSLDLDVDAGKTKEIQIAQKPELVNVGEKAVQSPKSLALKIEVELFKLFGGVNRKYREKGRSLLFNLKDQSNPELRERVMSGEISPERLCSMTAEELASEELSQWRIAKAEELAQMVVLPDSDVDIRRLVKKTHKGEFQVEVEQDDGVSVEVSVGTASLIQLHTENKDTEVHPSPKAGEIKDEENVVGEKSSSENKELSCSITIPNDGTDLMQGLMVDEFKDAEFLTPIVSLDEFMESLDSEPPFQNLPADGGKVISPKKESSDIGGKDPEGATRERSDKVDVKDMDSDVKTKSRDSPVEPKSRAPAAAAASKGDLVWEGVLQLNISDMVTVVGFFSSGDKTTTNEWPNTLDIKGRVRLDAFEKFLQELPMSRSRAVMVVHFVLKGGSSEDDQSSLSEVVYSYVSDERVGFAEPAPGVEIYFCPPHPKFIEILTKHLSKDHNEILNSFDSGLIGIIVWRKAHFSSTVFPNSKSHHKHSSKRTHSAPRRHQENDSNVNVNLATKHHTKTDDDADDIPPGFGPGVARDEEDLPEFNFSGATNGSLPKHFNHSMDTHLPVDQMRQHIQQYGLSGSHIDPRNLGIGIRRWNDDEDDIPEWRPEALPQQQLRTPPSHPMLNFQPLMPPQFHMVAQSPVNMMQGGGMWGQPHFHGGFPPSNNLGSQPSGGPYYGGVSQPSGGQYYGVPVAGQPAVDYRLEADKGSRGF